MERDTSDVARENKDYTFHVQSKLEDVFQTCAQDTEFPLEDKDFSHESFPWFANCVKNNVFMNPVLN